MRKLEPIIGPELVGGRMFGSRLLKSLNRLSELVCFSRSRARSDAKAGIAVVSVASN